MISRNPPMAQGNVGPHFCLRFLAIVGLALFISADTVRAQFLTRMQADSPEEFDAYLEVLEAQAPRDVIATATQFERAWPRSELAAYVYYKQLEAYQALGDSVKAIEAGEKALQAAPDNLIVLAGLSAILPNQTQDAQRLTRAERYARRVLEISKNFRVPRWMASRDWEDLRARLQSQAHAALGLVANQRSETQRAIQQFETAIALAPSPDATQYYRLGLLYKAAGDPRAAVQKLRKAAGLADPAIRQLAEQQLRDLDHQR